MMDLKNGTEIVEEKRSSTEKYFMLFLFATFCFINTAQCGEYVVIDNIMAR